MTQQSKYGLIFLIGSLLLLALLAGTAGGVALGYAIGEKAGAQTTRVAIAESTMSGDIGDETVMCLRIAILNNILGEDLNDE